jgi:glycosyltransferase involved in cell wall biosynthesis
VVNLDDITPLILTFNEAPNIGDTLDRLGWARRIVIVDSYSTDETLEIANRFANVTVVQRQFDHFADQCNFGLRRINTEWTLSLDADYKCSPQLADELTSLPIDSPNCFAASFQYCVFGKPLRASLYPERVSLYRTALACYSRDGHAHRVQVPGASGHLRTKILHDDRKSLRHWFGSQVKYAALEAQKLCDTPTSQLDWNDRLRRWYVFVPMLTLFYCLFVKRLIFDGRAGLYYALQRVCFELLLGLMLLDRTLRPATCQGPQSIREKTSDDRQPVAANTV